MRLVVLNFEVEIMVVFYIFFSQSDSVAELLPFHQIFIDVIILVFPIISFSITGRKLV